MAELGLIAAVVQVADVGFRLSEKLYTFGQTVASADESILFISKDISYTCSILRILEHSLRKDHEVELYSQNAVNTAETIVKECRDIFREMDRTLSKKISRIGLDGSSSRFAVTALERLRWPFLRLRMMVLWGNLGKLKSSLHLMLNVFIYARLLAERNGEPSVVSDLCSMIEHLLRTSEQQALNNEPLKAAIDCNENTNGTPAAVHSYIPGIPDLDAGNLPKKAPGKSGTDKGMEATKADSTTKNPDNYYTLMEHIMAKVEAEEYNIEPDMRRRIKDDVIRTLEREASLLRSDHGHTKSKGKMREKPLKVIEMANDEADTGEQPRMEQAGGFLSGAEPGPFPSDFGAQFRCFDPNHTSMGSFHKRIEGYQQWPTKAPTPAMSRVHTPDIKTIELFLDSREDPWNHLHLLLDALLTDKPKDAEVNGWLPFWTSGASMRAFHRIPPLNPLKAPLLSWRCCTSMLITEKSHDLESIASSQDLAALTDSTDTDTFVSARSEFGDVVLDTSFCRLEDEEKHVLLEILDGPGCRDAAGKDDPRLGVANFHQYMDGLLDGSLAS